MFLFGFVTVTIINSRFTESIRQGLVNDQYRTTKTRLRFSHDLPRYVLFIKHCYSNRGFQLIRLQERIVWQMEINGFYFRFQMSQILIYRALLTGTHLACIKRKKRNSAFTTAAQQRGSHKSAETYKAGEESPGQSNELITLVPGWSQEMRLKWLNRPTINGVMLRE